MEQQVKTAHQIQRISKTRSEAEQEAGVLRSLADNLEDQVDKAKADYFKGAAMMVLCLSLCLSLDLALETFTGLVCTVWCVQSLFGKYKGNLLVEMFAAKLKGSESPEEQFGPFIDRLNAPKRQ